MTALSAISDLTNRVASLTSIHRTTREDERRAETRPDPAALDGSKNELVARLRKVASELEKMTL